MLRTAYVLMRVRSHRPPINDVLIGGRDNDMVGDFVSMLELLEVESLVSRRRSGLRTVGAPS